MTPTFRSLVVPIDPDRTVDGARALPTAVALARRAGLQVDIVTVAPLDADLDEVETSVRELMGEPPGATIEVHGLLDADPASAIIGFLSDRPEALLVMSTHARGLVAERVLGSVSEAVLSRAQRPVLLVGPRVDRQEAGRLDSLVVGLGPAPLDAVVEGVCTWQRSFHGRPPWLVDVVGAGAAEAVDRSDGDLLERNHVRSTARRLEDRGIPCEWDVLHGEHVSESLVDFAAEVDGAVLALVSARWTDPLHHHLGSIARAVAHRAPCPVLVLPARVPHGVAGDPVEAGSADVEAHADPVVGEQPDQRLLLAQRP
jgi:nucleotide-binding universal stress UspA family protein